jgi:hypothetical protein
MEKTMSTYPNYELLRQAYAIIESIPETAIAFGEPQTKHGATPAGGDVFTGGDDSGLSDKRLWQRRMRDYLQRKGEFVEPPESGAPPKPL